MERLVMDMEGEVIEKLNQLIEKGYQGFVRFSGSPVDERRDLFLPGGEMKKIEKREGEFLLEGYFSNLKKGVEVHFSNGKWLWSEISFPETPAEEDLDCYSSKKLSADWGVEMIQLWEEEELEVPNPQREVVESFKVKRLKGVFFRQFKKFPPEGEEDEQSLYI